MVYLGVAGSSGPQPIPVPVCCLSWLSSACWVAGSLVDPIQEERQRLNTNDVALLMAQPSLPRGQS